VYSSETRPEVLLQHADSANSDTETETETETGGDTTETTDTPIKKRKVEPSMSLVYNTAMIMRDVIKNHPKLNIIFSPTSEDFNFENAERAVPPLLYNLMAWITGSGDDIPANSDQFVHVEYENHLKLLSILQDVMYLTAKGDVFVPKSMALGMTIKHWTGSSRLIQLMNKLGHCVSPTTVKRLETALAQLQLELSEECPYKLQNGAPTIFVADNIDFSEETISGHGTTHHTNCLAIQVEAVTSNIIRPPVSISRRASSLSQAPSQQFQYYERMRRSGSQQFVDRKSEFHHVSDWAPNPLDLAYVMINSSASEEHIRTWTGYNTLLDQKSLLKSNIVYLPVIEGSPTEMNIVQEIMNRALRLQQQLNITEIVCVFDLAIYAKVQEIRWLNPDKYGSLVVRMGEFHLTMSFLGVIGKRFGAAGLGSLLIESEVVAERSLNSVLNGHQYNRAVRAHKIVYEALSRIRFASFLETLEEESMNEWLESIQRLKTNYPSTVFREILRSAEFQEKASAYFSFVDEQSNNCRTYQFWSSYLWMVEQLMDLIRATRVGDWQLHLSVVRKIIPWFFSYNHQNYARYSPFYWLEMSDLPQTHPDTHDQFISGSWVVQRQNRYGFSKVACDQVIEQTINRASKTGGGIGGYTQCETAVKRWILSQPQRAEIAEKCEVLAGVTGDGRRRKALSAA
jgi:hypothetical protein